MEVKKTQPQKRLQPACDATDENGFPLTIPCEREKVTDMLQHGPLRRFFEAMRAGNQHLCAVKGSAAHHLKKDLTRDEKKLVSSCGTPSRSSRLREKYECMKEMRLNETQESLARECDLSRIIIELQKRIEDAEVSREFEREVHARESFYLLKENECLKEQVRTTERMLSDARNNYDSEISKLSTRVSDLEDSLVAEGQRAKTREAEQERAIQKLCSDLYTTQGELERYVEENRELASAKSLLEEMRAESWRAKRECTVWYEVLRRREVFMLLEQEAFTELQCLCMQEMNRFWRIQEDSHQAMFFSEVERFLGHMRREAEVCDEMKQMMFDNAAALIEKETWMSLHFSKVQELSRLSEKHEALSILLAQYMREVEEIQKSNLEQVLRQKTVDDASLVYMLHQRDNEVSDKLRTWKGALQEAHKLLTALLKRYEPFQRGDEVFVGRVMEWLVSAPHVKEVINVFLS
ncbi:hypothetical protein MOQ_001107 [Trypanosoma cruzi marinkellei]|uniref:Uncharacterized protein n=1 Tax=Trypanosoma cruzi marinkellei TaxID=85056 RepID=K2NUM9_TRYCR|nr:hypothetical protein MOQ_001107 [Trypanosoma cruzi marinkellei]